MTSVLSVKRSIVYGLIINLMLNVSLYVGQVLIVRTLSRAEYATFIVTTNFVILFSLFADLGLTPLFVRLFAECEKEHEPVRSRKYGELFGSMLFVKVSCSVLVSIAVMCFSSMLHYPSNEKYLMMIFLCTLVISSRLLVVRSLGEALLRSLGKYQMAVLFAAIDAVVFAVGMYLTQYTETDVSTVIWIYTFCNLPGFILLSLWIWRWKIRGMIQFTINKKLLVTLFKNGYPLALGTAFLTLHNTIDTIYLDMYCTPIDVSAYGAAIRVLSAMIFLPGVFALVVAPEVTKLLSLSYHSSAGRIVERSFCLLLLLSLLAALILTAAPSLIITILYGDEKYIDAAPMLSMFGWGFVCMSIGYFVIEMAIAEGKQWISMIYMFVLMAVSVVLGFIIIPKYGFIGAAVTKTVSVAIAASAVLFLSDRIVSFHKLSLKKFLIKYSILVFVFILTLYILYCFHVNESISLLVLLVVYPIAIHMLKIYTYKEVWNHILSIFKMQ